MTLLTRGNDILAKHPGFELLGRDGDLRRLVGILIRDRSNSVILAASGGAGSSAMCLGVQAMKADADVPFDVVSKRLFWLEVNELFAGGNPEEIKASFRKVLDTLRRTPESVLILADARSFMDGCNHNGTTNLLNGLLSAIRNRETQAILEVKDEDLEAVLRAHPDMRELFTILPLDEPARDALRAIVDRAAEQLGKAHGIRVEPDAVSAAIELTTKYRTRDSGLNRAQPEKSVTLLDRALATLRLDAHRNPPGIGPAEWTSMQAQLKRRYAAQRQGEVQMFELEDELERTRAQDADRARKLGGDGPGEAQGRRPAVHDPFAGDGADSGAAAGINQRIAALKAGIEDNARAFQALTEQVNAHLSLTRRDVLAEFSQISGIEVSRLDEDDMERLRALEPALRSRIFGQDEAVSRVANAIKVARVGNRHGDRPQAAFLFMGPSGAGKTEIAKALSAHMLGSDKSLTRFDMSEYGEKHSVAKLIGAPPGYEGFEAGGILTNLMRKNANRIVLFDEIEKGHDDIYNIFLQILSDGRLTDNVGRTVSFDQSIILMTTNIGQRHFLDGSIDWEEAKARAMAELSAQYKSELLNRFAGRQNILAFRPLGLDSIKRIVAREVGGLVDTYRARGFDVRIGDGVLAEFCEASYDPKIGARGLPGYIEAHMEPMIVDAVLQGRTRTMEIGFDRTAGTFAITGAAEGDTAGTGTAGDATAEAA